MITFPVRLRQARKAAKLTQENLALELGISKSQISAWENGKETPSWKHLGPLRDLLHVSIDWLYFGPLFGDLSDSIADQPDFEPHYDTGTTDLAVRMLRDLPADKRKLILDLMATWRRTDPH